MTKARQPIDETDGVAGGGPTAAAIAGGTQVLVAKSATIYDVATGLYTDKFGILVTIIFGVIHYIQNYNKGNLFIILLLGTFGLDYIYKKNRENQMGYFVVSGLVLLGILSLFLWLYKKNLAKKYDKNLKVSYGSSQMPLLVIVPIIVLYISINGYMERQLLIKSFGISSLLSSLSVQAVELIFTSQIH